MTTLPGFTKGFDRSQNRWFKQADPTRWNLPTAGFRRLRTLLGRAITRRCVYCGGHHIYKSPMNLKDTCPTCGVPFEREEGYFAGAYTVNLFAALFLGFGIVIGALALTDLSVLQLQIFGVFVATALPIFGYPFATALWIALDLTLDPPEKTAWGEVGRPELLPGRGTTGETAARLQREHPFTPNPLVPEVGPSSI